MSLREKAMALFVTGLAAGSFCQVAVRGGSFTMGGDAAEPDERPAHVVNVSALSVDKYETSFAEYDSCVRSGACSPAHYRDGKCILWTSAGLRKVVVPARFRSAEYPVVCVDWEQARAYCRFRGKRLLTEAEWEYAAQAGRASAYSWGDEAPSGARCPTSSCMHPIKSGSYPSNAWGLYDMTGNVWEWVDDCYQTDYYSQHAATDPAGPAVGRYRVIRGGGWFSGPNQLRIRNRQWFVPEYGEVSIGIRCGQ
jgi:formylglycine-generating enzyme required for sulfatase activity